MTPLNPLCNNDVLNLVIAPIFAIELLPFDSFAEPLSIFGHVATPAGDWLRREA